MKTTLSFFAIFIIALLVGCSEDLNLTDPVNSGNQVVQNTIPGNEPELLWRFDELCIRASTEMIVENKAVYVNPPFMYIADYLVTFDSYTDAGKHTSGYVPIVEVKKDGETVFEGADCPEVNPQGTCHREIKLNNVRFNELMFYVALLQGDNPPANQSDVMSTLRLSNIKIYLFE